MPISSQARMTRIAISPRLAINTLVNTRGDFRWSMPRQGATRGGPDQAGRRPPTRRWPEVIGEEAGGDPAPVWRAIWACHGEALAILGSQGPGGACTMAA